MTLSVVVLLLICVAVLITLILAEQPIWVALLVSGVLGIVSLRGMDVTLASLGSLPFTATAAYSFLIIPMFILMGILASGAGLAGDVYAVADKLSRRLPGGIGIATIFACGGFAAVTGSSVATVATVGRLGIKHMAEHGYRMSAAAAVVATGGTLGVLIPPSIVLVVYGILTGESVGLLLMAGLIPGIISILVYSTFIVVLYKRGFFEEREVAEQNQAAMVGAGPASQYSTGMESSLVGGSASLETPYVQASISPEMANVSDTPVEGRPKLTRKNIYGALYILILIGTIVGGLYSGYFTATEAGAVAALIAAVILFVRLRGRGKEALRTYWSAMRETASLTSMAFALLVGGSVFTFFLASTGIPNAIGRYVVNSNFSPLTVLLATLALMIVLGCFLDTMSILIITIPVTYPIITDLGIDGILFAILVVKAIEIGMVTPPVGLNVYVVSKTVPGLKPEDVFKAVIPFIIADLAVMGILISFPALVLWLPGLSA